MRRRTCVHSHDVISLTRAIDDWPRGTEGTVVAEHTAYVVVEVGDEVDGPHGFIDVPKDGLRVVWSARALSA